MLRLVSVDREGVEGRSVRMTVMFNTDTDTVANVTEEILKAAYQAIVGVMQIDEERR